MNKELSKLFKKEPIENRFNKIEAMVTDNE